MRFLKPSLFLLAGLVLVGTYASAEMGVESDVTISKIPDDQRAAARATANPTPATPESIDNGKMIFVGKGTCFVCHGFTGLGDGDAGVALDPAPRNFSNTQFHDLRTDGELFWVIKNGSEGTGMISYNPAMITDEETWDVINYVRTIKGQ